MNLMGWHYIHKLSSGSVKENTDMIRQLPFCHDFRDVEDKAKLEGNFSFLSHFFVEKILT